MIFDRRRYGSDNYTYLLAEGPDAALVDPGDPVIAMGMAAAHGVRPRWILHTHGHSDHVAGSAALRERLSAEIVGHSGDAGRFMPDRLLDGRSALRLGALELDVHHVPGHTAGSVLFAWRGMLLTGDTLFWGGCGNCRSGDPVELAASFLRVFPGLDGALEVHPGHDYGDRNLAWAVALEPGNAAARSRLEAVRAAAIAGQEPRPSTLEVERRANPFLRAQDPAVAEAVRRRSGWNVPEDPASVFVALRRLRDMG